MKDSQTVYKTLESLGLTPSYKRTSARSYNVIEEVQGSIWIGDYSMEVVIKNAGEMVFTVRILEGPDSEGNMNVRFAKSYDLDIAAEKEVFYIVVEAIRAVFKLY